VQCENTSHLGNIEKQNQFKLSQCNEKPLLRVYMATKLL
jgi:hypothetical protein